MTEFKPSATVKLYLATVIALSLTIHICTGQDIKTRSSTHSSDPSLPHKPTFDVVLLKPANKDGGPMGIYTYPGGKVYAGQSTLKMLIGNAFNIQAFQIEGGPGWMDDDSYDITALPPDSSSSRQLRPVSRNASMNEEQRTMMQSLLVDRFALKFHRKNIQGKVYFLTKGRNKLTLKEPKYSGSLPFLLSPIKQDGVVDGELTGNNISMTLFAMRLSKYLDRPVLDRTGLTGSFDFHVPLLDPSNRDVTLGIIESISSLGLNLKGGKGSVYTIVIDSAEKPIPD